MDRAAGADQPFVGGIEQERPEPDRRVEPAVNHAPSPRAILNAKPPPLVGGRRGVRPADQSGKIVAIIFPASHQDRGGGAA